MTKTNRFTLIATVLLGVLLYTIIRFAGDLNVTWDGRRSGPSPVNDGPGTPDLPVIASTTDLHDFLERRGLDANAMIAGHGEWSDARGFTGRHRLSGSASEDAPETLSGLDQDELHARSAAGDAAATQALATVAVFDDLTAAIGLYRLAAEQGSTYALLRSGYLLESLDTVAAPTDRQRALERAGPEAGDNLRQAALAHAVAAIRDAGIPIVDPALLDWLDHLSSGMARDERSRACAASASLLLDIARNRARRGKPTITTAPPPVFFAVPDLVDRLPCADSAFPIENLLDLADCTAIPVLNAAGEALELNICPQ